MRSIAWRLIAVAATAIAVSFPMSTGVAFAATGVVETSGAALTVRAGPGAGLDAWSSVANGSTVSIVCQTEGSSVTGSQGTSTIWDMLSNGGFVSDAYVHTGSDGYVEKKCSYVGAPPRANPRGVNAAISWQFARLGSTAHEGWCMRFQAQSYGWGASGWASAEVGGDWIQSHGYMRTTGIPPRGAIVWYHNSAGTGHVVVSLGEGKIIGTSVSGKVGVAGYLYRTGYRGWSVPHFPAAG
ncbi:hypothetical protein [Tenggerimyces flavus]|uniref:CHAP domain-containing protein n=1 Tax=Tenggerimyces flavus TaxID=1708749 RepID=A0ABV7YL53_9ACTN|nr:hypothetical protein [Tenggerimyces flavus]MBM7789945.1 uncharacterized protein YraI [Tenggerimyces flavus]